jgi:hypothetical protein
MTLRLGNTRFAAIDLDVLYLGLARHAVYHCDCLHQRQSAFRDIQFPRLNYFPCYINRRRFLHDDYIAGKYLRI